MQLLRAAYTEIWVASQNVPLVRFADRVRGIASTGLDLVGIAGRSTAEQISATVQKGGGRMPGFPNLSRQALDALVQFAMGGPEGLAPAVTYVAAT